MSKLFVVVSGNQCLFIHSFIPLINSLLETEHLSQYQIALYKTRFLCISYLVIQFFQFCLILIFLYKKYILCILSCAVIKCSNTSTYYLNREPSYYCMQKGLYFDDTKNVPLFTFILRRIKTISFPLFTIHIRQLFLCSIHRSPDSPNSKSTEMTAKQRDIATTLISWYFKIDQNVSKLTESRYKK